MKGDLDSKTLTIELAIDSAERLDGKSLLLLLNNKKVLYEGDKSEKVSIKPFTSMHWLPLSVQHPQLATVTYTRERLFKAQGEYDRLMGKPLESEEFMRSIQEDESNVRYSPFAFMISKPTVVASIDF